MFRLFAPSETRHDAQREPCNEVAPGKGQGCCGRRGVDGGGASTLTRTTVLSKYVAYLTYIYETKTLEHEWPLMLLLHPRSAYREIYRAQPRGKAGT